MAAQEGFPNGSAQLNDIPSTQFNSSAEVPLADRPARFGWQNANAKGYTINEVPSGTLRPLQIIGVGAGASGINLAKSIRDESKDVSLTIYEKGEDIGGTWLDNRYP